MGISGDMDKDENAGLKATASLVARFCELACNHLLQTFESVYIASLHANTLEERNRQREIRDETAILLGKLMDLHTMDDRSTRRVRKSIWFRCS